MSTDPTPESLLAEALHQECESRYLEVVGLAPITLHSVSHHDGASAPITREESDHG